MAITIDCKYVEERDLATSYLAGELSPKDAEAFEQHYFACERCWREVQAMSALRAALGKPVLVPVERRPTRVTTWRLLAVAAIVTAAGLGLWQLTHRPPEASVQPVLRGGAAEALAVTTEALPGGRIKVSWRPNLDAQVYVVEVIRSDGVPALKLETGETSMTIDRTVLPAPPPGISFATRVRALDPMRQVVAASELTPLPQP